MSSCNTRGIRHGLDYDCACSSFNGKWSKIRSTLSEVKNWTHISRQSNTYRVYGRDLCSLCLQIEKVLFKHAMVPFEHAIRFHHRMKFKRGRLPFIKGDLIIQCRPWRLICSLGIYRCTDRSKPCLAMLHNVISELSTISNDLDTIHDSCPLVQPITSEGLLLSCPSGSLHAQSATVCSQPSFSSLSLRKEHLKGLILKKL